VPKRSAPSHGIVKDLAKVAGCTQRRKTGVHTKSGGREATGTPAGKRAQKRERKMQLARDSAKRRGRRRWGERSEKRLGSRHVTGRRTRGVCGHRVAEGRSDDDQQGGRMETKTPRVQ